MLTRLTLLATLVVAPALHAQARPTASRAVGDLQIGGGVISAQSDYDDRFKGFFGYADLDILRRVGVEVEVHQIYSSDGQQIHERTYEIGARYHRTYGRIAPYAKIMVGRGVFNFPFNQANLGYNMVAGGGGLDIKILRHLNARADFEYQHWFNFQGGALTPSLASIGAAYHF